MRGSFAPAAQSPGERPDRDAVDVQDVLGEVDANWLVLRIVPVGAKLHVPFVEPATVSANSQLQRPTANGRIAFSTESCRYRHDHLERALRPIPLGKRNWLFASSEVGAQRVGIIQSLLVTCRLHEVDAYTYLVDVLQRITMHPANRAIELTPRMWKSLFADDPLRSNLGPHNHDPPPH